MGKEQRRHARYAVLNEDIVLLVDFSNNVAKVRNISLGGVQLEYLPAEFTHNHWDRVDILSCKNNRLILTNIPCEVVYDIKSLSENGSFTGMDVRICGLCYLDLAKQQRQDLQQLLAQMANADNDGK